MIEGVDFSWGRPTAEALVTAGKKFVIRYVPYSGDGGKGLTAAEVAEYRAARLAIVLVYERTAGRALTAGFAGGKADADESVAAITALGLDATMPIYFAVDRDTTNADWPAVDNYLAGAASVLGVARVGVYGEYSITQHCRAAGTATWFWQTYAWSGGKVDTDAHLYQYLNGQKIDGAAVDFDIARQPNYGQEGGSMAKPALLADHIHISEREPDGTWEDCTWDSGLEWYRLTYDPSKPATHAEAQKLRAASGEPPTGGSNIGDLKRGIKARYGKSTPTAISGFSALWTALTPGKAAVCQGSMKAFGPDHRLSKWDRNFDGGHAVLIARIDTQDRVWWCDPEAPDNVGYEGTWVTKAELKAYVTAFGGQHLVRSVIVTPEEEDMTPLTSYLPGYTADVKPLSNVRVAPIISSTKLYTAQTTTPVVLIGTVKGDVDPANGKDVWYTWWDTVRKVYAYTALDNIRNVAAPVTDCGPIVEAATAPLKAEITKLEADLATATETERDRIASAEADRIRQL